MTLLARVRAVIAAWQCFACSTWNPDQAGACSVCSHDPYGFDTLS